jgi:sarcosine oxidase subunit beta
VADVIVIGGGIAGCATAYYLAADGVDVLLLEAGELNGLASGANAGSLHAQIPHDPFVHKGAAWARGFLPAVRLYMASLNIWRDLEAVLDTDLEIRFGGGLLVAANDVEMRQVEAKAAIERSAGLPVEMLDATALHAAAPYLADRLVGGALCPVEGKANPLRVAPAFAAAARRRGATIRTGESVSAIARVADGYEVRTQNGVHRARRIVNAAGVEAGNIVAGLGVRLPMQAFPIQVSVTQPTAKLMPHLLYAAGEKLTMKQSQSGTILIGGGWDARLDARGRPVVDPQSLSDNLAIAMSVVPAVGALRIVRTWAAIVNGTEDWLPIIGEVPGHPGLFITYVPWIGFTAGPAAARATADLVQGKPVSIDVDMRRFAP